MNVVGSDRGSMAGREAVIGQVIAVRAYSEPQTLARVLGVFAQRAIVPESLMCRRAGGFLLIDAQLPGGDARIDLLVLERLRAMVCVDRADFVQGAHRRCADSNVPSRRSCGAEVDDGGRGKD